MRSISARNFSRRVRFFFIAYSALAKLRWLMVGQGLPIRCVHACMGRAGSWRIDQRFPKELLEKLGWLFLSLPGFLCVSVIGIIVDLGELSEFQITYYSFIATLPIVVLALALSAGLGSALRRVRSGWPTPVGASYIFYATSVVVAIVMGIALGMAAQGDQVFRALRSLPGTDVLNKRSAKRPLVFLLNQNSKGQMKVEGDGRPAAMKQTEAFARIKIKDGPIYEGWPEFYEHANSPSELYLSPACRVSATGEATPVPGPGVILIER